MSSRFVLLHEYACESAYDFNWKGYKEWIKKIAANARKRWPDDEDDDITLAIEYFGSDYDLIEGFLGDVVEPTLPSNEGYVIRYNEEGNFFEILHVRIKSKKKKFAAPEGPFGLLTGVVVMLGPLAYFMVKKGGA